MEPNRLWLALVFVFSVAFPMGVAPTPSTPAEGKTVWDFIPTAEISDDKSVRNAAYLLKVCQSYIQIIYDKALYELTDEHLQEPKMFLDNHLIAPSREQLDLDIKGMVKSVVDLLATHSEKTGHAVKPWKRAQVIGTHLISELSNLALYILNRLQEHPILSVLFTSNNDQEYIDERSHVCKGHLNTAHYYRGIQVKTEKVFKKIQPVLARLQLQWSDFPALGGGPPVPKNDAQEIHDEQELTGR
jgi:hypothetical protein